MKKALIVCAFVLLFGIFTIPIINIANTQQEEAIKWIESYDVAAAKAKEQSKDMFILITAPSWCKPCQWLEKNVFNIPEKADKKTAESVVKLQKVLNTEYIPVRIFDTNEKDIEKFNPEAYPTLLVYSKEGKFKAQIKAKFKEGEFSAAKLLSMLEKIKVGAFDSTADDFASGGCGGGACPPGGG